jgi:hypothetical protein
MALPDYFHTAERIIRHAMLDSGRLQLGAEASVEALQDARDRLADLIYAAQVSGIKLWLQNLRTVTLVAEQVSYDFEDPRELRVINGWYVLTAGNRRELGQRAWQSFHSLGDLTQTGTPTEFFVNKQAGKITVTFWLIPNAQAATEGHVELLCQTQPTAPVELSDEIGFPKEWYLYLRWGLADDLTSGQHQSIVDKCAKKAQQYKELLEDWDVEDGPTHIEPDLAHGPRSRFAR